MGRKLLSPNDQRIATLFADENDCNLPCIYVKIEEHTVLSEQANLSLGNGIRPESFQVSGLCHRIGGEPQRGLSQKSTARLSSKPTKILNH